MIALDTGDSIRADASVADKIDYTIHGMVNDDVEQLSDGQFAAAEADIYTAPSDAGIVATLILVNTHNAAITCNVYLKPSGGTSRRIIPKDTSIGAGYSLQYDGIRLIIASEVGEVSSVTVIAQPADTFVAEDGALGKGVLLQGDDGTDRKNVAVNASGKINVIEQEAANIETHLDHIENRFQADGEAIDYGLLVQGNDGTDRHNLEMAANGDLKITLDSEAIVLGTGAAAIGKLAANSGIDIGDVDVTSLPALVTGSAKIGSVDVGDLSGTWTCISIDISTATTTALKAGVAGHTYTVISISLTIAAENNLTWKSAANLLSGPMDFGASGEPHGWQANLWPCGLKCVAGETLNLTTSTTGQVSGFITVLDES